jgi:hypothetical protein
MRVTPSLPHRGRQHAGSIPLTPSFFGVLFSTFSGVIAIWGMPERREGKHDREETPRAIDCVEEVFNKAHLTKKDAQNKDMPQNRIKISVFIR